MRIAVIGSGNIGGTLGVAWARAGHDVVFGVRDPTSPNIAALLERSPRATAALVRDACVDADAIVLAVPGVALGDVLGDLDPGAQTIIVDATNKMGGGPMNGTSSIRDALPDTPVFRAFNSLGWENFAEPMFDGVPADLFYCGPEGEADAVVASLIGDVGLRPVRVGELGEVEVVDSVTRLWFALARIRGRHLAFKVLE